jgi:hypothetical protein
MLSSLQVAGACMVARQDFLLMTTVVANHGLIGVGAIMHAVWLMSR